MNNEIPDTTWLSDNYISLRNKLGVNHPLYNAINDKSNLKVFMESHVYAVWDFMSLVKSVQLHIAPASVPWIPPKNARFSNFINQLVLEEESDEAMTDTADYTHASHFESYLQAMQEVGANTEIVKQFVSKVEEEGFESAIQMSAIPKSAKQFMQHSFGIITSNQPHILAAALAYGREDLIPLLFRVLKKGLFVTANEAPSLHGYLDRHIELDEKEHGPIAMSMVQELCGTSVKKQKEAMDTAEQALLARLNFWDGIYQALN